MTILRSGASQKYSQNWSNAFGVGGTSGSNGVSQKNAGKKSTKKADAKPAKKAAAKKTKK